MNLEVKRVGKRVLQFQDLLTDLGGFFGTSFSMTNSFRHFGQFRVD